ncbi:hypothetical protein MTR67_017390 [Solanum verrucosum]|uniref:Gag-pol polyprotein n=1 Tax=Solanum verrucosum TaxID=315347 RepID=A0AAF0QKD8_SOLVR|nr:hypothetical protein MTR67_017390 [Solanum verrucosum]
MFMKILSYDSENREVVSPVNPNVGGTKARVRGFTSMNHPEFLKSKVEEDPQEFINEVCNIIGNYGCDFG